MLILFEDVSIFAWIPICACGAIFFNEVGTFAEPRVVFGVVSAGFGDVFSDGEIHLIADLFGVIYFRSLGDGFVNERVGVFAVPFVFEIPSLMIDASADIINFVERRADPFGEHHGCALHGVT